MIHHSTSVLTSHVVSEALINAMITCTKVHFSYSVKQQLKINNSGIKNSTLLDIQQSDISDSRKPNLC